MISAAATVARDAEIVVIGSQAILAQFPSAPAELLFSQEADVYPRNHPERAIEVDAALGDGSPFHETFGYYAHGVGPETAKAPAGWQTRLVPLRVTAAGGTRPATGWCIEVHDLVLSKCAAGRERDWAFARVAIQHGLVEPDELLRRGSHMPLSDTYRGQILDSLRAVMTQARRNGG